MHRQLPALKESPEHLLITILIGNNIVNVAAASLATAIAIQMFGDIGVGIATGFVVIVLLVFGEIGPKIYATRASDSFALTIAPVILFLSRIFTPLIWLVERVSPKIGDRQRDASNRRLLKRRSRNGLMSARRKARSSRVSRTCSTRCSSLLIPPPARS